MLNVLVVDNDAAIARLCARVLCGDGALVSTASSAADVRRLGRQPWDALVIELNLPGEDGLRVAEELRAFLPNVGVVLMAAQPTGLQSSGSHFLLKPFSSIRAISAAVRDAVQSQKRGHVIQVQPEHRQDHSL